jgi:hypothetical protein
MQDWEKHKSAEVVEDLQVLCEKYRLKAFIFVSKTEDGKISLANSTGIDRTSLGSIYFLIRNVLISMGRIIFDKRFYK